MADGDRKVGLAVAEVARHDSVGHAGDRKADRRCRLEGSVAVAEGNRDRVGSPESDGHIQVIIVVEVAYCDRGWVQAGVGERRVSGRGLKRSVAGSQVDAVRSHIVENPIVGEVTDGDWRVASPLEVGGQHDVLRGVRSGCQ